MALYLAYEAVMRLLDPAEVKGEWVMAAAGVALVVDVLTAAFLWAMSKGSLNVRAAFVHNLTDAAASVVVLAGGAAIWMGWPTWIDPLLTLGIAGYILYISWGMLQRTASILMENTPPDLAIDAVEASMREADGVLDVHHLHVWEIDEHHTALTAHVVAREPLDADALIETKAQIKRRLVEAFGIGHSTLEFEFEREDCMGCEASLAAAAPTTPPEQ